MAQPKLSDKILRLLQLYATKPGGWNPQPLLDGSDEYIVLQARNKMELLARMMGGSDPQEDRVEAPGLCIEIVIVMILYIERNWDTLALDAGTSISDWNVPIENVPDEYRERFASDRKTWIPFWEKVKEIAEAK